jgi:hypothetical protein
MSSSVQGLAARRAELIAQCAGQRATVAQEVALLRSPFSVDGVLRLVSNNKLLLAAAGIALGVAATRPRRLLALAAGALPVLRMARTILPLLQR